MYSLYGHINTAVFAQNREQVLFVTVAFLKCTYILLIAYRSRILTDLLNHTLVFTRLI